MSQDRYPVFVEYTHRHIVWVDADDPEQAARCVNAAPYEYTDNHETLYMTSVDVQPPKDKWDWQDVYDDSWDGAYTTQADAHVQTHRAEMLRQKWEADKAACVTASHPNTERPLSDGRRYCRDCREYLPAEAVTA
jgi:hypothetical protein